MSEEKNLQKAVGTEAEADITNKYLVFYIGEQSYGIEIERVIEIINVSEMTIVPQAPPYVKGIINVRGIAIPLIDINIRLGYAEKEYTDRTCIIVVSLEDECVGFIVDAVDDVMDIADSGINPIPQTADGGGEKFVLGMAVLDGKIVLIMSCDEVIAVNEFIDDDDD